MTDLKSPNRYSADRHIRTVWRKTVADELTRAGAVLEVLPSGATRIVTRHEFVTCSDLADLSESSLFNLIHRNH